MVFSECEHTVQKITQLFLSRLSLLFLARWLQLSEGNLELKGNWGRTWQICQLMFFRFYSNALITALNFHEEGILEVVLVKKLIEEYLGVVGNEKL